MYVMYKFFPNISTILAEILSGKWYLAIVRSESDGKQTLFYGGFSFCSPAKGSFCGRSFVSSYVKSGEFCVSFHGAEDMETC